jgi:hypothetical protein
VQRGWERAWARSRRRVEPVERDTFTPALLLPPGLREQLLQRYLEGHGQRHQGGEGHVGLPELHTAELLVTDADALGGDLLAEAELVAQSSHASAEALLLALKGAH